MSSFRALFFRPLFPSLCELRRQWTRRFYASVLALTCASALLPAVIPSNLQCLLATEKKRVASSVHRERPTSVVAFRGGRIRVPATAAALRSPKNVPTGETHLPAALQLAAWSKRFLPSFETARGGSSYPGF